MPRKIINDPVYGFITIDDHLILNIIDHPIFQRLRYIHQMAYAQLVYPGAVHSRLHHSLGAYHLACVALQELRSKDIDITDEELLATKIAVLLHDVGHGPFSHALESEIMEGVHHETVSILLMKKLNEEFEGKLDLTIKIFTNNYHKKFLYQLISSQLDVDRLDYLNRDSFYTGVAEGVIGYDRILKMLHVHNGNLVVEEKAIYSVEKFLLSRRLMYWQVYLHKTVLSAELMLKKVLHRAKELLKLGENIQTTSAALQLFFENALPKNQLNDEHLQAFCLLDDSDILSTIKKWSHHPDKILSTLSRALLERRLYKIILQSETFKEETLSITKEKFINTYHITPEELNYYFFNGEASNTAYEPEIDRINILYKDGSIRDITQVENALIQQYLSKPIKKYYLCCFR